MQPGDVYKVSFPRSDLKINVAGIEVKPTLALGSWLAFKKTGDMTLVMGDLVLNRKRSHSCPKQAAGRRCRNDRIA
jgi:hypothetical protein